MFLAAAADSIKGQALISVASSGARTVTVLAVEARDDGQVSELTIILGDGAYVRDGASATQNFGSAADLIVKKSANAGNTRETYLKFDLSSYTSVTSAKLRLNAKLGDTTSASLLMNVYATTNTTHSFGFGGSPSVRHQCRGVASQRCDVRRVCIASSR